MTSGASFSLEDYKKLAAEKMAEQDSIYRSALLQGSGGEELLWTALVPSWTVPLAEKSGFPVKDVTQYLEGLRERALVRVSQLHSEEGEAPRPSLYTMDDVTRADVIEAYADEPGQRGELRNLVSRIADQMLNAIEHRVLEPPAFAPAALVKWAVLAAHASRDGGIADEFDEQVEEAFERRESATIRDWMNAGQPFSGWLLRDRDDSMKQALHRASQRLILLRREENDQRHLKYFFERDEQLAAFEELMSPNDNLWATHFLGAGGVGKTMLVRKITVDWAKDHDAIAARVDFDYLKADYPTLDPGMLLWAFAQDLRAYAGPDSIRLFNQAERQFKELSKRLSSEIRDGLQRRATELPQFREAISIYAEALSLLPKRVVLIVDTCEELAKITHGRTPVENIDETFRILRALHDGAHTLSDENASPSGPILNLRVIFSGRRPLSVRGFNWHCPSAAQLKERKFLRLHEVRGFEEADAAKFLAAKMQVPGDLIPAIVKRSSPDTGSVAHIEWTNPNDSPSKKLRCNPYDLRLYAEWAREEPPPTATQILDTPPTTQYVELRVIRRLHVESLKEVLPAVALLGHFDSAVLHEIFQGVKLNDPVDRVFELLQDEEWINQRPKQDSSEGPGLILDVEPGLRTRLFLYFRNSPLLAEVQPRAADYFERITLEGDPNVLDWSTFDSAITVLESDPDTSRVFRWWKQVEERMFSLRPPSWFLDVTEKLQNEGGAVALRDPNATPDVPPESRLRAAVLASNASARLRSAKLEELTSVWRDLAKIWEEVLAKAATVSDVMPELETRARAGFISASLRIDQTDPKLVEQIHQLWRFVEETANRKERRGIHPQLAGALVAAAEAIVEFADTNAPKNPSLIQDSLTTGPKTVCPVTTLARMLSPELIADADSALTPNSMSPSASDLVLFAACLVGRAESLLGNHEMARQGFRVSLAFSSYQVEPAIGKSSWHDWRPPEDLASRVRLEFVRAAYPAFMSPGEILKLIGEPPVNLHLIDNERLHSALLSLRHADGVVPEEQLSKFKFIVAPNGSVLYARSKNEPGAQRENSVPGALISRSHHVIPPLFVTVLEVLASQGQADILLHDLAAVANSRSESYKTLLDIDRACSRMILRMRLRDVGEKGGETLKTSAELSDRSLAWALDAHDGTKNIQQVPKIPENLEKIPTLPMRSSEPGADEKLGDQISVERWKAGFTTEQLDKLRWLHAIWQTRFSLDGDRKETAKTALTWAEQNLKGCLSIDFENYPCYELAAVQIDCFEALALATKDKTELNLGHVSRLAFAEDFFHHRTEFSPVEALTLSLRTWAMRDRDSGGMVTELAGTLSLRARALSDQGRGSSSVAWTDAMIESVGSRRAAEIALHEADLLSLRMPDRAAYLYRQAQVLFDLSGDRVGEFFAATAEAMMLSHREAKAIELNIANCYVDLLAGVKDRVKLPSQEDLNALIENPDKAEVGDWAPRSWRPRLMRYLLVLRVAKSFDGRASAGRSLIGQLLPGAIGEITESHTETYDPMPADLANWFQRAYEAPSIFRRAFDVAKKALRPLAGLAIIIAVVYGLFWLFGKAFSLVAPDFSTRGKWLQAATFAIVILFLSLLYRLSLKVRRQSKPDQTEKSGQVSGSDETATASVPTPVSDGVQPPEYPTWKIWGDMILIWGLMALIAWLHFASVITTYSWISIAFAVLLVTGSSLLAVFRGRFSRVGKWLQERNLEAASSLLTQLVRIDLTIRPVKDAPSTDRSLTEVPELEIVLKFTPRAFQFLLVLVPAIRTQYMFSGISGKSAVQPYQRLSEELAKTKFPEQFGSLRQWLRKFSMAVQIDLSEGSLNGLCWESLLSGDGIDKELRYEYLPFNSYRKLSLTIGRAASRTEKPTVLALAEGDLGQSMARDGWKALEKSSTGISFELKDRNEIIRNNTRPEVSVIHLIGTLESSYLGVGLRLGEERLTLTVQSSQSAADSDPLVRVEDITRAFPNLSVCVIQEEPRQVSPQRLEGDRRDAFFARIFASQMFAAGVPFVLVIPPLRITEASAVIDQLAQLLARRSRLQQRQLLKTIGDLRLQIGRYGLSLGADPVTAQELPQDLCIYLNREWDGRLT